MNLAGVFSQIKCFQAEGKYTDTVLKFSDGHIWVHWGVLEAHGSIWWTVAREASTDSIVEVIIPDASVAEGETFVDEIYSSIQSFKLLKPNSDGAPPNTNFEIDTNNNSFEIDIEQDENLELLIRSSADVALNESEHNDPVPDSPEAAIDDNVSAIDSVESSNTNVEDNVESILPEQDPQIDQKSTTCSICGKLFSTNKKMRMHMSFYHDETVVQCDECQKICKGRKALRNHKRSHQNVTCNNCGDMVKVNSYPLHRQKCLQIAPSKQCPYENCDFLGYYDVDIKKHIKKHKRKIYVFIL